MTPRPSPWLYALLAAAAAAVGWFAWRTFASGGDGDDAASVASPAAEPKDEALDPRVRSALALLKEADVPDPVARAAKAKEAVLKLLDAERAQAGDATFLAFWRGVGAVMAGDEREARAALDRTTAVSPNGARDPRVYYLRAKVVLAFEPTKPEQAVRLLRTLKGHAPGFMAEPVDLALFDGLRMLAAKMINGRDADGGVAAIQEALTLVRRDPVRAIETRRELARALGRAGRWLEAGEEWSSLVDASKGNPADRFMLAVSYAAQNRWEPAIEHYSAVVAMVDGGRLPGAAAKLLREALMRRGNAHRYLGHNGAARADLERYVQEVPEDSRGHYWLGMYFLDALDDASTALPHLEKARTMAPWCEEPLQVLLTIYTVQLPDGAKAAALRRAIDDGVEDRKKERARVAKERADDSGVCQ